MILRDYQLRAVEKCRDAIRRGRRSIILQAPCGAGKTVIAAHMLREGANMGNRGMFAVDAIELVNQSSDKLDQFDLPLYSRIGHGIMRSTEEYMPQCPVQVVSVQTWDSWCNRRGIINAPKFDFLFLDECQSSMARTRQQILGAAPIRIGLTATPAKSSGEALGEPWQEIIVAATYSELISSGDLVPIRCKVPSILDTTGWKVNYETGDFIIGEKEIESIDRQITGSLFDSVTKWCRERRFLVFCCNVKHSIKMAETLTEMGIPTAHVDAKTPSDERAAAIGGIRDGSIKGLTNYNVFGRGVDLPEISAVLNCRPFRSLVAYRQAMARGGRPCDGKVDCLVIDHTGAVLRHGYPDDDLEWPAPKADSKVQDERFAKQKSPIQRLCPKCGEYWEGGRPECPSCGYQAQRRGELAPEMPGSLTDISRKAARKMRRSGSGRLTWMKCLGIAAHKEMTVRQARIIYHSMTGQWPDGLDRSRKADWDTKVKFLYPGFIRGRGKHAEVAREG